MNSLSLQKRFRSIFFVTLLLSLIVVKSEAKIKDNLSLNSSTYLTYLQCPYVRELSAQKKAKVENENSKVTKQIFSFLFPGSPRINSLLGTFYISSIPNFILYFVPPDIQPSSLNLLVSFAVGGLLGDVFLHLLPHSFLGENSDNEVHFVQVEEQKNVVIGLAIFVGFTTFFVIDKLMRVANGKEGHSHTHDMKKHEHQQLEDKGKTTATKDLSSLRQRTSTDKATKKEENKPSLYKQPSNSIKLSAYLNLIADATHNFTDGLAMAASFYTSPSIGATTTVAVFFHEIPHEIGDYAILVQSGFTKRRAMLSQFITAIGAFLGTLAGILIEEYSRGDDNNSKTIDVDASNGVLGTGVEFGDLVIPFTAGGFLYIATVGVIPELLEVTGKLSKDIRQAVTEFLAMFIGVSMMAIIAWNEGA